MACLLLENGANKAANKGDASGQQPLHVAIGASNLKITRLLLKNGARTKVDWLNTSGRWPLDVAVAAGNVEIARLLLENGARPVPNKDNPNVQSPLQVAICANNTHLVLLLIKYRAEKMLTIPYVFEVAKYSLTMARVILDAMPELRFDDQPSPTPADGDGTVVCTHLMVAICDRDLPLVKLILKYGGSVHGPQWGGYTLYCYSLRLHRMECMTNVVLRSIGMNFGNQSCTRPGRGEMTKFLKKQPGAVANSCVHVSLEKCDQVSVQYCMYVGGLG